MGAALGAVGAGVERDAGAAGALHIACQAVLDHAEHRGGKSPVAVSACSHQSQIEELDACGGLFGGLGIQLLEEGQDRVKVVGPVKAEGGRPPGRV